MKDNRTEKTANENLIADTDALNDLPIAGSEATESKGGAGASVDACDFTQFRNRFGSTV